MYQEEHEACRFWMTQLDVGLTPPLPAFNLGSAAARGGKKQTLDPGVGNKILRAITC